MAFKTEKYLVILFYTSGVPLNKLDDRVNDGDVNSKIICK
jgi:hypothetical protein